MVSEFNLCFNSSGGFETKLLPTLSLTHNFTFTKLYLVAQFFYIIYFHQQRSSRSTFRQESPDAICATPSTHGSVPIHTQKLTEKGQNVSLLISLPLTSLKLTLLFILSLLGPPLEQIIVPATISFLRHR